MMMMTAIWGLDFRASIIILTDMLKQIKQIIITLMTTSLPVHQMKYTDLYATTRNSSDCCLVYSALRLQCLGLCAWKVRLLTSKLDNCNEVGSQLPYNAHISMASCLNNPGERNDR